MAENLGTINRFIRAIGGVMILYGSYIIISSWSFVLQLFGLYGIFSALLGQCFICEVIKDIIK